MPEEQQTSKKRLRFLDRLGLRWRIFFYFLTFVAVLVVVLWLFQIVYLNEFYQKIKVKQIEGVSTLIQSNIDNEQLFDLLTRVAQDGDICLSLYVLKVSDTRTGEEGDIWPQVEGNLIQIHTLANCLIHKFAVEEVQRLYVAATEHHGLYTEIFELSQFYNSNYDSGQFKGWAPPRDTGLSDSMVLSRIIQTSHGDELLLLLNSSISPVDATVDTLRIQLLYISIILVVLALIISFFMSRHLAAPIARINEQAKGLGHGDFSANFDGKGYKETLELAKTLNYAADEISHTERLQRELIANISHDLRTPLTMIGGYAEVMRDLPNENNAENAQVIIDEVRRLSSLVSDVLDLSKLQAGVAALERHDFDLVRSVTEMVDHYSQLAAQEGYTVRFEHEGMEEAWVNADESKISQVIYNFLNNALTYTGADKTVTIRLSERRGQARLEVIDSGPGIAEDRLPYIWQRYYRSEESHVRASHGSGLGLSIVRGILEQHKVKYGVISKMNEGSTFWFELPLIKRK